MPRLWDTAGVKRENPTTKRPFQRGDKRPPTDPQDGLVFFSYNYQNRFIDEDGFYKELWVTSEALSDYLKQIINPNTGKVWQVGDINQNGEIYTSRTTKMGGTEKAFVYLRFYKSEQDFLKKWISSCFPRWKNKTAESNLTKDYLFEIFPKDFICPVLGTKMSLFDRNQETSPSLDRIDNSYGYVKGNVCFMSMTANRLKGDASIEQMEMILKFIKEFKKNNTIED